MKLFIRSRNVLTIDGIRDAVIEIAGEKIAGLWSPLHVGHEDIIDFGSLVISPGLVDPHVHINEPGRSQWEGFETATRAAAAGGITTLVDMPLNSSPVTTTVEAFERKVEAARGKLHVDCGFHAGLIPDNAQHLQDVLDCGVLGVKVFLVDSGIDEFPKTTEGDLRRAFPAIVESGLPLLVHAELQSTDVSPRTTDVRRYSNYLHSRPRKWENDAVAMMIRLCKEFGCRVHIVHVSSSEAIPMIREAKRAGVPISAETCPHYLFFSSEEIPDGATQFKCAPPIRERENNERLWDALKEGTLDFIASDHSPCPPDMKLQEKGDFVNAWGGIASLQFGLPIIWTQARRRGFEVADVSRWLSTHPAKLVGLESKKGTIAPGFDADFVIWDPEKSFSVESGIIHHRHKLTPYLGRTLVGSVHATFVRGRMVFQDRDFAAPTAKILSRRYINESIH